MVTRLGTGEHDIGLYGNQVRRREVLNHMNSGTLNDQQDDVDEDELDNGLYATIMHLLFCFPLFIAVSSSPSCYLDLVGGVDGLGESLLQTLGGELLYGLGDLGRASGVRLLGITGGVGVVYLVVSGDPKTIPIAKRMNLQSREELAQHPRGRSSGPGRGRQTGKRETGW